MNASEVKAEFVKILSDSEVDAFLANHRPIEAIAYSHDAEYEPLELYVDRCYLLVVTCSRHLNNPLSSWHLTEIENGEADRLFNSIAERGFEIRLRTKKREDGGYQFIPVVISAEEGICRIRALVAEAMEDCTANRANSSARIRALVEDPWASM